MVDRTPPAELAKIPEFNALAPEAQKSLLIMHQNMQARELPASLVLSGLQSTARLMLEQQTTDTPIMETESVRRFIEANHGATVSRRSRTAPHKETRQRSREALLDRLTHLVRSARASTRRHEILRLRREMLGLDQGYIRRTLGTEGDRLCADMNDWLVKIAPRLHGR